MSKKNILIVGVGGTGSNAVDQLYQKIKSKGNPAGNQISAIVLDTDSGDLEKLKDATAITLADTRSIGTVCDSIGRERISEWFPVPDEGQAGNKYSAQELHQGAGQWRKKSFLAFTNLLNIPARKKQLDDALNAWIAKDPDGPFMLLVVASIAGGTGSGSFIPLTLYIKNYMREKLLSCDAYAMVACPGIYSNANANIPGAVDKIHANAYAIIRELNAMNLVTSGNDDGVNFHLGTKDSPTGVLFDSSMESFKQSERTPFKYIYLMDKLITCDSIQAHDSVLANSLYSLICTEAGDGIDSIESNVGTTKDPSAIYAGVASAQILYPAEAILDYAAHQKTLDAIQKEWMILHNAVEDRISSEIEEARRNGTKMQVSTASYAQKFLEAKEDECSVDGSPIAEILLDALNNATVKPDDTVEYTPTLPAYVKKLMAAMDAKIPSCDDAIRKVANATEDLERPKLFGGKAANREIQRNLADNVPEFFKTLNDFYHRCDEVCNGARNTVTEHIFPTRDGTEDKNLSIAYHVLRKGDNFIHPVAAMTNLCQFRTELAKLLKSCGEDSWTAKQTVVPTSMLSTTLSADSSSDTKVKLTPRDKKDSYYCNAGTFPLGFMAIKDKPDEYQNQSTFAYADMLQCCEDVAGALQALANKAKNHIRNVVLTDLLARVDLLIESYRAFFKNFNAAKSTLETKTNAALHRFVGVRGGVIYLCSEVEDKQRAYKEMAADANSPEAQAEGYAAAGKGVYAATFQSAVRKYQASQTDGEVKEEGKQAGMFDVLFDTMIDTFKKALKATDAYTKLQNRSLLEAIAEKVEEKTPETLRKAYQSYFKTLSENATPSLKIPATIKGPATVSVVLISSETADYLREKADMLGLNAGNPSDSITSRNKAAAEDFFSKCGITGAKIFIVDSVPASTVYLTTVILNVKPQQIQHFDEMSAERNYYSHYCVAVEHLESGKVDGKNEEDMWNPHLGNNLHRHGYLPYINPLKEEEANKNLSRALLFAFFKGYITYMKPVGQKKAFRCTYGGNTELIRKGTTPVTLDDLSGLYDWLRPREALVAEWVAAFDREITRQLNSLHSAETETEQGKLEAQLSASKEFITAMMRDNLFRNTRGMEEDAYGNTSMSLMEFTYLLSKTNKTDARYLLQVGYEIFQRFCAYRFNLKTDEGLGKYCRVLNQQTKKFMYKLLVDETVQKSGDPIVYAQTIVRYANGLGCFRAINQDDNINDKGEINFVDYDLDEQTLKEAMAEKEKLEARKAESAAKKAEAAAVKAEEPASQPAETPAAPAPAEGNGDVQ